MATPQQDRWIFKNIINTLLKIVTLYLGKVLLCCSCRSTSLALEEVSFQSHWLVGQVTWPKPGPFPVPSRDAPRPGLGLPLPGRAALAAPRHRAAHAEIPSCSWFIGAVRRPPYLFPKYKSKRNKASDSDDFKARCDFICHTEGKNGNGETERAGKHSSVLQGSLENKTRLELPETYSLTASQAEILKRCTCDQSLLLFVPF